ncbi:Protein of unknown function DUF2301 [Ostreococcus tauri]|uniref:Integral membrane protein n=1 Tax=Ostreococcus tauri TaxID=70448 RepID=Q00YY6_OSTTA|nr:Protein of unknown function DUF2301 [Ostreococcus tauri]CAL55773.1 Protein of unknown function DUF2301 [Ostreococcus tauri]|eukprot:XP_003081970.1 Protein of unknown function DUF2301 [Ostreococcus tauri]
MSTLARPIPVRVRARARASASDEIIGRSSPPLFRSPFAPAEPFWTKRWKESVDERIKHGTYCDYVIDARDRAEVFGYRLGVVACAVGLVASAVGSGRGASGDAAANVAWFVGGGGLGLSLWLIHMYVSEIRSAMRLMWGVGYGASALIAGTSGESAPAYVLEHPSSMLAVGWMFAALTGLAFKEGMCYGKPEAGALFFGVPLMCLSHLFGAPEEFQSLSATGVGVLLLIFAARKFTQPVADDVGDKSIFMFNAIEDPEEKERWLVNARASGRTYVDEDV